MYTSTHIIQSKIHRFTNNHHICWIRFLCCWRAIDDSFIVIYKFFVWTWNADNEITMLFQNCNHAWIQLFNFHWILVSNFVRDEKFHANQKNCERSKAEIRWLEMVLNEIAKSEKREINHHLFGMLTLQKHRLWKGPRYWKISFWVVRCCPPSIYHTYVGFYWFFFCPSKPISLIYFFAFSFLGFLYFVFQKCTPNVS